MYSKLEMYKLFKKALQDITNIKNIKIGGRNLIVHTNEYKGKCLGITGAMEDNSTSNVMKKYISVTPKEVLYFSKTSNGANDHFRWNWYDVNKNYISRTSNNNNSFSWTVPDGAHYIWVSYPNTGDVQLERANKPSDFRPSPEDIESALNSKANSVDVYKKTETYSQTQVDTKLSSKANSVDVYKKSEIDTKLNSKANSADVYKKTEVDTKLSSKANSVDVYKKTETYNQKEVDTLLGAKANSSDMYTQAEINTKLNSKANSVDVYKKTEIDTKLNNKANSADVYTKTQTDNKLSSKANSSDVYKKTETYSQKEIDDKLSTAGTVDAYTKSEIDTKLNSKANSADVYKKTEVDTKLSSKANSSDVYTKTQTDNTFATKTTVTTNTTNIATNKNNIATNKTNIATNKTNITNLTTKVNNLRIVSVSSLSELSTALTNATAGTQIKIKAGTYAVDKSFEIPKGVTITGSGMDSCIFKCNNTLVNNVFRNKLTGTETGYNNFDITIEGIKFDGFNTTHNITPVAMAHASNVIIRHCLFQNFNSWNNIELNGCHMCYIQYNKFLNYGYASGGSPSEVIQLDFCKDTTGYPWTCKYDLTHCKDIYIEENYFYKAKTTNTGVIGTHNHDANGACHSYIYVRNNVVDTVQTFFCLLGATKIYIEGNTGRDLQTFVILGSNGHVIQNDGVIANNVVSGDFVSGIWGGGLTSNTEGRFIYGKDNTITISSFAITGNVCNSFNGHCIGLTCRNTTICNNRIYGAGRNGIFLYGGSKIACVGNVVVDNACNTTVNNFTDIRLGDNPNVELDHTVVSLNVCNIVKGGNCAITATELNNVID